MSTADQSTAREEVSMGAGIIAVVGTFTGISALFVAARLYVRIKLMHNIGLDDYLIVLAMVSFLSRRSACGVSAYLQGTRSAAYSTWASPAQRQRQAVGDTWTL